MTETLIPSSFVAFGGIIGTVFAENFYPPLGSCWWVLYTIAALVAIPTATAFVLDNCDRLTRYATLVRFMMVMAAASLVTLAAYFFLNGILDGNPRVEAPALVSQEYIAYSEYGTHYVLVLTVSLNGEKFEGGFAVSPRKYHASKPGDSVRVTVHRGKFSEPWYGGVVEFPHSWDYTDLKPNEPNIVGKYRILELRLPSELRKSALEKEPEITLGADHTAVLTDVPIFDDSGKELICRLGGVAHWALDDQTANLGGWTMLFQDYLPAVKPTAKKCESGDSMGSTLVLNGHVPFRLYSIIGEQNGEIGVVFERVASKWYFPKS
jgi:hypothetical protein